jgi:PIN domain nuclease of toxin-antitoxin system
MNSMGRDAVLLDTCALIWLMAGSPMRDEALGAIAAAAERRSVLVSPITALEIGHLVRKRRLVLTMSAETWFEAATTGSGFALADMPPALLIASALLPGDAPPDPADRVIIATARQANAIVVTRDHRILRYAEEGQMRGLGC